MGTSLDLMYSKHVPACKLLLQRLTRHPTYIDDLLLACNNNVVRSTLASLIGTLLRTVAPLEDDFLLEREVAVLDNEAGGAGTGAGNVGADQGIGEPRAVVARFIDMYAAHSSGCDMRCQVSHFRDLHVAPPDAARFVGRLGEARKNWTRFSDYFSVLLQFAKISHKCRAFVRANAAAPPWQPSALTAAPPPLRLCLGRWSHGG